LSDPLLVIVFVLAAAVSLRASILLVTSLERVGARLRLSEALLGMLAALAADAPEITAAVTALVGHEDRIGAGVILGSNVFNIAALIGLAGIVAGHIALHPRVIELGGAVALWIAGLSLVLVLGVVPPLPALLLALAVFVPYLVALGVRHSQIARLPLPAAWTRWLVAAISEEEEELEVAIHPRRGGARDARVALVGVAIVVGASIAMEQSASTLGSRLGVPAIVIGGIVLAGVTSLPNAVAGVYLARRGRGSAVLSTSLNSNAINVLAGLLIPTTFVGIASASAQTTFVAAYALAMTVLALVLAYTRRGLARGEGILIVLAYVVFAAVLVAIA
jgi:cation:H+ antiporter